MLKAGSWHLVHRGDPAIDVLCVDHLRATRLTNMPFTPPDDFDLGEFWRVHVATRQAGVLSSHPRERIAV